MVLNSMQMTINKQNQTKKYLIKNENEKKLCKLTMRTGHRIKSEIWNKPYFKIISATDEGLNVANSKCKIFCTPDKILSISFTHKIISL
jgi:hypothetical protein